VRKSKGYLKISFVHGTLSTLSELDDKKHAIIRRIINQGLSESHIRTMDSDINAVASVLVERLGERNDRFEERVNAIETHDGWTAPKNMARWSGCDDYTHFLFVC
jgi:cytochrome P450